MTGAPEGGRLVERRCAACGYGVSVRTPPARCPMCGGEVWALGGRPRADGASPELRDVLLMRAVGAAGRAEPGEARRGAGTPRRAGDT